MPIQRALTYGLCAILLVAPLPFGSVRPEASALLVAACCALGVLWVIWRSRRGLSPLPWRDPVLAAGALIALLGVLQTLPLPRPLLEKISPRAVELRERYEPAAASPADDHGRRPISLYPWATRQATLRFAGCWLALLVTLDLAAVGSTHRTLATGLVAAGGFQAIYGLAEYFSGHQQIFGYEKKWYTDVATGTFINRNHFAGFLEMTIPLAVALAATSWARLGPPGKSLGQRLAAAPGQEVFRTAMFFVLTLTMATALVCSRSRMGIGSTLLALLAVGSFLAWHGRGKRFILAALLVAGFTLVLFSQGGAGDPLMHRFLGTSADLKAGVGRWSIWNQAFAVLKGFPITGVGLGVFPSVFPAFRDVGEGIYLDHAHNDYLEFASEMGAVGCGVLILVFALLVWSVLRRPAGIRTLGLFGYAAAGSVLAMALHSITDFNLAIPSNALTASVLLGFVLCWIRSPSPVLAIDHGHRRPWAARCALPAAFIGGMACLALFPLGAAATASPQRPGPEEVSLFAGVGGDRPNERDSEVASTSTSGGAERLFQEAADLSTVALKDLQVLAAAKAEQKNVSATAAQYIQSNLAHAIRLQTMALRQLPTSAAGHIALGHMLAGQCAALALTSDQGANCVAEALPEFRLALELSPVSATTHAQVATFLLASWPLLTDTERSGASPIIERAIAMNRADGALRRQWDVVSASP